MTLLGALARRSAAGEVTRALCTDGHTWLSVPDLLAGARPAQTGAARGGAAALRAVPTSPPLEAVTGLLRAEARGEVPAVVHPGGALPAGSVPATTTAGPLLALSTSGSTSRPRLVLRTMASWADSLEPFTAVTGIGPDDVVWAPGELSSTLTLFAVWHALATGVPVVAGGRWRGVVAAGPQAAAATVLQCVPAVLSDVLDARAAGLLPRLRTAVVAGASTAAPLRRRAGRAGLQLVEYYGAAELSFVAVDADGSGLVPFPGVEVAVREGLIWARSAYTCLGYLSSTAGGSTAGGSTAGGSTAGGSTAGPWRRDPDGWCTVGDRGHLDGRGRLSVRGRGGDAASVGGHVVLLADVEHLLAGVDGVAELVCLSEPHARLGERVVAAVRPDGAADPVPALRATARLGLPVAARPVRYVLVTDLPRTTGGKVARAVLRERVTRAGRAAHRG